MSVTGCSFFVPGFPVTKGSWIPTVSPKSGKLFLRPDSNKLRPWEKDVGSVARTFVDPTWINAECSWGCAMQFIFPRYKKDWTRMGTLKADAPADIWRYDLDKLVRAVLDALTGVVWRDDNRVTEIRAHKQYVQSPSDATGVLIHVFPTHARGGQATVS